MGNRLCCIFNVAPHYNAPIYKLMDKELGCDFYFGDRIHMPIKLMNYEDLKGYKSTLKYIPLLFNFYWQKGAVSLVFKPYKSYMLTGEVYCLSNWVILLGCFFSSKKVMLWSHGYYGDESRIKKLIKKIFFKLSSHIFLYGDYALNLMIKEGFHVSRLTSIYNSMDYEKQLEVRTNLKPGIVFKNRFKNNNPILIYIGRIQKSKRLDLLIEAIKRLKEEEFYCNLVIVGEEAESTGIGNLIDQCNLNQSVWQFGACFDEAVIGELIFNSDLCVSPGSIGLTAIHSLMYGTPIITHRNFSKQGPEFEAIQEGITGCFFEENNVAELSLSIRKWLLDNSRNRESIRQNCYSIVHEKYNPNKQIEVFKNFF